MEEHDYRHAGKAPLAVIVFNRPDLASKLYDALLAERSRELFVISDGPRNSRPEDADKVESCRRIFSQWSGKVHFINAKENMGCRARIVSGLDLVFEKTDRVIILEDDCIPHPDFFTFVDEMLDRYETDTRVMSISGTNWYAKDNLFPWSYCFSRYQNCWGWATWKRGWQLFDRDLLNLDVAKETGLLKSLLGSYRAYLYWHLYVLEGVRSGRINSWAYIWTFSGFVNHGLQIIPHSNLVINVGAGEDATHTTRAPNHANDGVSGLDFPLVHPPAIFPLPKLDAAIEDRIFSKSIVQRLIWALRKIKYMFLDK
jgi:hypothetical protein